MARYRAADAHARWHARGKLAFDPLYRALLADGNLVGAGTRLLDLGCGQALVATLLDVAGHHVARAAWPAGWSRPPKGVHYTGIDHAGTDLCRARAAAASFTRRPGLFAADLRQATLPACDLALLIDVLHYLGPDDQEALIRRVHAVLPAGGRLLLRVGDGGGGWRQVLADVVDRSVVAARGGSGVRLATRPLGDWLALLERCGFDTHAQPMHRGTPFANVLLVARRRSSGA
ncbi:MAG: class I SAM-dependent methyltransferase [Rubrivivax sp.]